MKTLRSSTGLVKSSFRNRVENVSLNLAKNFAQLIQTIFLNTRYPSQTVPLDTESAVLTTGQRFHSILKFSSIKIRKKSKKRKVFSLFKLLLWNIAQTGRRMQVILKHFSKNLEANKMKRFVFKKYACILLKSIFNTVAICSFVCWVPCNLFSLDLQLLRDILKTETWFFQLKFAKCVYIFNWWLFTFVRNLKTLRTSTGLVKSSISNLVENLWSKIP